LLIRPKPAPSSVFAGSLIVTMLKMLNNSARNCSLARSALPFRLPKGVSLMKAKSKAVHIRLNFFTPASSAPDTAHRCASDLRESIVPIGSACPREPRALLIQHVHQTPFPLQALGLMRLQIVPSKVDHQWRTASCPVFSRHSRNSRFMNHRISKSFSDPSAPVPLASNR
jgi:hypothetical protein